MMSSTQTAVGDWMAIVDVVELLPAPAPVPVTEQSSGIVSVQDGVWFTSSLIL